MAERRSGIDLVYCAGGWAVVYGTQLLGLYQKREEAIQCAREDSTRILSERRAGGTPVDDVTYPRLRSRRHPKQQAVVG